MIKLSFESFLLEGGLKILISLKFFFAFSTIEISSCTNLHFVNLAIKLKSVQFSSVFTQKQRKSLGKKGILTEAHAGAAIMKPTGAEVENPL